MAKINKRHDDGIVQKICVDKKTLAEMLSVGLASADEIGIKANAKIHLGKRTIYHVGKIDEYLQDLASQKEVV